MNKKAQNNNPVVIFGGILIALILLSGLGILVHSLSCSNEISQRDACYLERNYWKNQSEILNGTIQNCSNLINEQKDICDERINASVQECQGKVDIYMNFVIVNKIFFVVYNIMIILIIPLTINLFKIVVDVGLKEEWKKKIYWYQKTILIFKIVFWVALVLGIIGSIIALLISNPITP